ncbi:MAG: hypothetical protein NC084_06890 [Bacteroides sp.]|nr:hypothetical protein [Eubacterium sp.]MCM1419561.1 hypothetical protein [Roseburia sp.]MCM1462426.1 hypothetical protein [Bacteroides sp.]
MLGHFGFSYVGSVFLLMLFIPNILWTKRKPKGYDPGGESKVLLFFERTGEVLTCFCAVAFSDLNLSEWTAWSWWLVAAFALMLLYEGWWVRYFLSARELSDFYADFAGVPLAGATLPVAAFFLLGVYGKVLWLMISAAILGVGHIGIHLRHKRELERNDRSL